MIILCCLFLIKVKIKVGLTKEGFTNIVSKFHSFTSLTGSLVPRPATKWCGPGNEANSLAQQSNYSHSPIQCLENNETVSNHVAGTSIHDIVLNRNTNPMHPHHLHLLFFFWWHQIFYSVQKTARSQLVCRLRLRLKNGLSRALPVENFTIVHTF